MKHTPTNNRKKETGLVSFISVFIVGTLALGVAFALSLGSLGQIAKSRAQTQGGHAFYAADAAAREGLYQYMQVNSYNGGYIPNLNNTESAIVSINNEAWPYVEIRGTATRERAERSAVYVLTTYAEGAAFENAVYANNQLDLTGSVEINGNIYANDSINFSGNSVQINGNAYSSKNITGPANVSGEIKTEVDSIPPPSIDFDMCQGIIEKYGVVFDSAKDAENYLNNQNQEALIFVNSGEGVKIQGSNTNLKGSLVVVGDLDITGGTFTAEDGFPAIIVHGNLSVGGGAVINGAVYATGSTSFGSGNNIINGSLISAGGINTTSLSGNTTINYQQDDTGEWQEIVCLNKKSAVEPKIINWYEE